MLKDSNSCCSTAGGADAVRLITGALVSARRPPILLKDVRKSFPLQVSIGIQ